MARRELDTSKAKCDKCGKPYQDGDAVYSIADKFDEDIEDRDVLLFFRHWDCHTPPKEALKEALHNFDKTMARVDDALDRLRRTRLY